MQAQKYSVNQYLIGTLLASVDAGEIAIPEIQRPFVWSATKVRDLMDSLYKGFPVGYIIAWRNPTVRLKDGSRSEGKRILIDGQQRVTALSAALLGQKIVTADYRRVNIRIAFHPLQERFEVFNTAIERDPAWIPDIAPIVKGDLKEYILVEDYIRSNPAADRGQLFEVLGRLTDIAKKQIGVIELDGSLDIETVTEIFVRINSKGVVLSQADFAMSKIAANETYGGSRLRKCIDYFCHLAVAPGFYQQIAEEDADFASTEYLSKIAWLRNENDSLYDPDYSDLVRVAFTAQFNRGRMSDLVSLLSGRNFEMRTFDEDIVAESFERLKQGVLEFINETNFKRFVMIVRSAGFVDSWMLRSKNAVNFAYVLYLKLRTEGYSSSEIERYVRRWLVLSLLTSRYSGGADSQFDVDIKSLSGKRFQEYLVGVEAAELSDAFWNVRLVQQLTTASQNSSGFSVYLAAQCRDLSRGFLSRDITIRELVEHRGDLHHVFPKDYLKKKGIDRSSYDQIANLVYMQSEINVKVGNRSPLEYFGQLKDQCSGGPVMYGGITTTEDLCINLGQNDLPQAIMTADADGYESFLAQRRVLMANRLRRYYESL